MRTSIGKFASACAKDMEIAYQDYQEASENYNKVTSKIKNLYETEYKEAKEKLDNAEEKVQRLLLIDPLRTHLWEELPD